MNKILFYLLIAISSFAANAQATFKYCNPKHFKGYGIVFTKEYKPHFTLKEFKGQFTPTMEEIDTAEAIFMRRYDADINIKKGFRVTHNPVKYYKHSLRQYMGLIDSNSKKLIVIQMLDVRKPRRKNIEYYYGDWETEFITGFGDFYERNPKYLQ